jgi:hypothetical protein
MFFLYIVIDKMRVEVSNRSNVVIAFVDRLPQKEQWKFFFFLKAMEVMWVS